MDGVIVNSTDMHTKAWRMYLKSLRMNASNLAARMLGKHNDELVRDLFRGRQLTDNEVYEHGARKEAIYRDLIDPDFARWIVPGVTEFVRRHRNSPMAVATNAEPANVDFVLGKAGIRDCFPVVINGHEVKRPKPFPDIYLRAAEQLGAPPGQCVVFEDSPTGVEAAIAAGMRVVGLSTTLEQIPGVDLMVEDFLDPRIEPWLEQLRFAA